MSIYKTRDIASAEIFCNITWRAVAIETRRLP